MTHKAIGVFNPSVRPAVAERLDRNGTDSERRVECYRLKLVTNMQQAEEKARICVGDDYTSKLGISLTCRAGPRPPIDRFL